MSLSKILIIYFLRSKVIFSKTEKSILARKIRKWFKIRTNWVIRGNSFFFKIKPVKIWLHRRQPAPWCPPFFSTLPFKTSQNIRFLKTCLTLWHDDIALENIVKHTVITQVIMHKLYRVNPIKRNTKLTDLHYISDLNRSGFKIYKVTY